MREIKFRAWNGNSLYYNHSVCLQIDGTISYLKNDGQWGEPEKGEIILMQYTGLKDKNGKEVYEGDIIEFTPKYKPGVRKKSPVIWQEFRACFAFKWNDYANEDLFQAIQHTNEAELIGNIYENPELLNSPAKVDRQG